MKSDKEPNCKHTNLRQTFTATFELKLKVKHISKTIYNGDGKYNVADIKILNKDTFEKQINKMTKKQLVEILVEAIEIDSEGYIWCPSCNKYF